MLRDDLYTVVDLNTIEEQEVATIAFNPSHDIFKGHFPENPMVPGVVLLKIVHELLEFHGQYKVHLVALKQSKFLAIINPTVSQKVQIIWNTENHENQLILKAKGVSEQETFFKISAVFERL